MMLAPLVPAHRLSDVFPERAAMTTRYWPGSNPWLPEATGRCEVTTANLCSVAGGVLTVAHHAAITPLAEELLARTGLEFGPTVGYSDFDDYLGALHRLSDQGNILGFNFTPPVEFQEFSGVLVPVNLQAYLNDKANLAELVPPGAAPERVVVPREKFLNDGISAPRLPIVLKAATSLGNGGGLGVRICRTQSDWEAALHFFRKSAAFLSGVVVERYEELRDTWCAIIGIGPERVEYWGAARQVCSAAGQYQGNWMGVGFELPEAARDVVLYVAEQGQKRGYCGTAGMDLGWTGGGRLLVFDLNFRTNGCTLQVLLHDAACARIGALVSRMRRFTFRKCLADAIEAVGPWVDRGVFVPESAFDAALHPDVEQSSISGIVLGADTDEVEARMCELDKLA